MQKVKGVTAVRVSLNEGLTVLDLSADNVVKVSDLRQIIRNNGFVTREAAIVARGSVVKAPGGAAFQVSGSAEALALAPDDTLRSGPNIVVISGTVDLTDPKQLRLSGASVREP
jgi:hypothetical protein